MEEEEEKVRRRRENWTWARSPLSNKHGVSTEMIFTQENKIIKKNEWENVGL